VTDFGLDEGTVMAIGSQPVVVLQGSDGFRAFSAVCTHLGCIVGYDTTQSPDIVCPCHDGHFSASTGSVISGPPPAPLQAFPVAIDGDQVFVQG
jgi:cytochrome b6-f complex iron-sulfur subunit